MARFALPQCSEPASPLAAGVCPRLMFPWEAASESVLLVDVSGIKIMASQEIAGSPCRRN